MVWDEDTLEYGYVLDRIAGGGWWHLHFGRSGWSYHCDLLGRRTKILASVERFAAGAVAESPRFLLTLDGEGVGLTEAEAGLDFRWGDRPADPLVAAEALHFQREIMPLLYDSPAFQRAAAEVVARQRHLRVVASGKLGRAEPGAAPDRRGM
jgi:hypothetical protein